MKAMYAAFQLTRVSIMSMLKLLKENLKKTDKAFSSVLNKSSIYHKQNVHDLILRKLDYIIYH